MIAVTISNKMKCAFYETLPTFSKKKFVTKRRMALFFQYKNAIYVKFIYSEKATKFCEISTVDLTVTTEDKFKVEISQNFVAFSEYMNFNR